LSVEIPSGFETAPRENILDVIEKIKEWPSVFVIDDFHLCCDNSAAETLLLIRSRMPAKTSFLILSRNPPPEVLNEHILSGKIQQMTDLRLDRDEIISLFKKNNTLLSKHEAELIYKQTDGWAAALTALLMSDTGNYTGALSRETLNQYLRSHVFEQWERFDDLKKCSICDFLNPKLCETMTGRADTWDVIAALAKKTGLVASFGNNIYKFHDLLKGFLQLELESDMKINKPLLYKTAAYWYMESGDWLHTLEMASKTGDNDAIDEIVRTASEKQSGSGIDIAGYIKLIEKTFLSIPIHIIEQYPRLSLNCFLAVFLSRPISEAQMWADMLEKQMEKGLTHPADDIAAAFQRAVDPRHSSWYVPQQFKRIRNAPDAAKGRINMISISLNFPFFHKAQRDYTDISCELPEYITEIISQMEPVAGPVIKVMAALIESGIRYERGELNDAEAIVEKVIEKINNFQPEIRFCAYILHNEILRVQGKDVEPQTIGDMIENTGARYLSANFRSYTTTVRLYNGDESAAVKWLERESPIRVLQLYKIHRHITSARAMMVTNKLNAAVKLLERLAGFSQDYRRNADYIEALTLRAICLWRMKRSGDAVKIFTDAVIRASELRLITPIVKEGCDIQPVLQKILNRLKYGYDADILDKSFINELFLKARNISKHIPGMFSKDNLKPIGLSPRQSEVMGYLVSNLSYREISEKLGVTKDAADYHIRMLHKKLGVSNNHDLLLKAEELGLVNIE
jgi:ATP/maltotriose-dependent transcriptional regulator MalT